MPVHPSTKSFLDFSDIWYLGSGRRVMHDSSDAKTGFFFTTDYRFAETGVLPVIETSLLFETIDERRTGQAYAVPCVNVT